MIKAIILLTCVCLAASEKHQKITDPFEALDRHISHTLAYHYLWPWSQILKAASSFNEEDFNEPQIISDTEKLVVNLNVRRFKPEELTVKVRNKNIIIDGHRKLNGDDRLMADHFSQRFILPAGSKQEEVTAVLKENGILTVTVPRHEVPPPPPERLVPIEVMKPVIVEIPEKKTDKPKKPIDPVKTTEMPAKPSAKPVEVTDKKGEDPVTVPVTLEQLDLVEATTAHAGKIRKKELKDTKTTKDNEVTKGVDQNGLDFALMESE